MKSWNPAALSTSGAPPRPACAAPNSPKRMFLSPSSFGAAPARSAYRRERGRQQQGVLLPDHNTGRVARRPVAAGRRGFTHAEPFRRVLVRPDMNPFVQRTEFRIPATDER